MVMTKGMAFEYKIARERRDAQRTAVWREARNDAPACPWIYPGFEELPNLRRGGAVGSVGLAEKLERRLRERHEAVCAEFRAGRRGQRRFDPEGGAHA